MKVLINPYSDVFIGNGKSINKGETFLGGDQEFYLLPTPFYSAFREKINGIFLFYKRSILMPIPKDIFSYKEKNENFLGNYKIKLIEDRKLIKPGIEKNQKIKEIEGFIAYNKFSEYLKTGKLSKKSKFYKISDLIKTKVKPNVAINKSTKTVEESMLFFKNVKEFVEDLFVLLDLNTDKVNEKYLCIGGENSIGLISKIEKEIDIDKTSIKEKIKGNNYFKIIILTPTNYPPDIDGAKRVAQLTGKTIAFSGWFNIYNDDKKISFPSRLFKLIPAGAVFYYKINDEIVRDNKKLEEFLENLFNKYWLKPSFFVPEYPYFEKTEDGTNPLGFGLSIIGIAQVEES